MGFKIGQKVTTNTQQTLVSKEKHKRGKKKERKRVAGIDYSVFGGELSQKKGDVTHVEFYPQDREGYRFSVDGHFAIYYRNDSPEIQVFTCPDRFKDNKMNLDTDNILFSAFIDIKAVEIELFSFIDKNKPDFIVK